MPHEFSFTLSWKGETSTADYNRDGRAAASGKHGLELSSAPAYKGNPERWNPEELLGVALVNCHMLTFLALATKNGIVVLGYEDMPKAVLDTVEKSTWVTEIRLNPLITVRAGTDVALAESLFQKAHKHCFVANSIRSHVTMEPRFQEG